MTVTEAQEKWGSIGSLLNHFSNIDNKQIKGFFTATEDPILAGFVHFNYQHGMGFPFRPEEKQNPYIWVVFTDNSIQLLSEVLRDEELVEILDRKGIAPCSVTVEDRWSDYIPWRRGFGMELTYSDKPLTYEISDGVSAEVFEETIPQPWSNTIFFPYRNNGRRIDEMRKPRIRFRAPAGKTVDVTVVFEARG